MIDLAKTIGAVAASVAALGGSYTLADKFGWFDRAIIEWSPENFKMLWSPLNDGSVKKTKFIGKRVTATKCGNTSGNRSNSFGKVNHLLSFNSRFNLRNSLISCLSCARIYRVSTYAIEVAATTIHIATPISIHQTRRVVATLATQKT